MLRLLAALDCGLELIRTYVCDGRPGRERVRPARLGLQAVLNLLYLTALAAVGAAWLLVRLL